MDEEQMEDKDGCCDDCDCEEISTDDLAQSNQVVLSALIHLLVEKGVIKEDELDALLEEDEESDEDGEEGSAEDASPEEDNA